MKWIKIALTCLYCLIVFNSIGQQVLSSVIVTDVAGSKKDILNIIDSNKTTILIFWNVWSHISQNEIDNFVDWKDELKTKYNAEVILISMDDTRNSQRVKPFVDGRSWPFQCYIDLNGDLKRALNVLYPPSTVIISPGLKVFSNKIGYAPGDEETIINKLSEIK